MDTGRGRHAEASRPADRVSLDALPQIVWTADPGGACTFVNRCWTEHTGLGLEDSLGEGFARPMHPEDRAGGRERWQEALRTGGPFEVEYRVRGCDGAYRWFLIQAVPTVEADGRISGWVGTCTDVDDLKRAEAELARRTDRLRLMHEASRRLSSTLDPSEVREALHRLVAEAMPCDGLLVSSYDPEERLIRCEYAWADGRLLDPATLPPLPLNERGGMQSEVIRTGEPRLVEVPRVIRERGGRYVNVKGDGSVEAVPEGEPRPRRR